MLPIFIKSFKKLPNHPTKANDKFESRRILFDSRSPPIKGYARRFSPFMIVSPYLWVVQSCAIAQNLRKGYVYMSL